jgi:hypothetical protein
MHRFFKLAPTHALGQETAIHQRGDAHTSANNSHAIADFSHALQG